MTLILSFDPGKNNGGRDSGTGWCLQDEDKVHDFGVVKDLVAFLTERIFKLSTELILRPDTVVYEGYHITPRDTLNNVGKDLTAIQNIGAIKLFASLINVPTFEYFREIKPTQAKATGLNAKNVPKAQTHWIDAYNHGRYWLIQFAGAPSALEIEMKKNGEI